MAHRCRRASVRAPGLGRKAGASMQGPQRRMNDIRGGGIDGISGTGGSQEEQQNILQQVRPTMDMKSRDVEQAEFHPASHPRENELMSEPTRKILPREERYPFCIVWSPLGPITSCFPYVGHMGICDSRVYGTFRGHKYAIGRDNMAFGNPTRILKLNPELCKGRKKTKVQPNFGIAACTNLIAYTLDGCTIYVVTTAIPMLQWPWKKMQYAGLSHWNMVMLAAWVFLWEISTLSIPRFAWSCCPTIVLALIIVFFYGLGNSSP